MTLALLASWQLETLTHYSLLVTPHDFFSNVVRSRLRICLYMSRSCCFERRLPLSKYSIATCPMDQVPREAIPPATAQPPVGTSLAPCCARNRNASPPAIVDISSLAWVAVNGSP